MNTTQQKCFIEAAELLNFTAAAERLYISQPALSRNISALEEELGVMLFLRRNNVLSLTPGGEILYRWMKENAESLERARLEAKERTPGAATDWCWGSCRAKYCQSGT